MRGEQIDNPSNPRTQSGSYLLPFAAVAGVAALSCDDRLQGAQSALNRVQVWLGDIFIDFAAWRRQQAGASHGGSGCLPGEHGVRGSRAPVQFPE